MILNEVSEVESEVRSNGLILFRPFRDRHRAVSVSLRSLGDMSRAGGAERACYARLLGLDPEQILSMKQIHSRRIVDLASGERLPPAEREADGLLLQGDAVAIGVTVADCVPVFLYDPRHRVSAALHSGWRGTGIVVDAVRRMEDHYSSRPEEIEAFIGPSIGPCCYRVDAERAKLFASEYGVETVRKLGDGEGCCLDLHAANRILLRGLGLKLISESGLCTSCDERFGSFRREGPDSFTRMLALIGVFQ